MDVYGPPLPPGFQLPQSSDEDSVDGPSVKKTKVIGPEIPTFLTSKLNSDNESNSEKDETEGCKIVGPVLPPSFKQITFSEEDIYGPMPAETETEYNIINIIEKRASSMKDHLDMKASPTVETRQREEWMVVPDTSRRNQLGAISRCLDPGYKAAKKEEPVRNLKEDETTTKELKKYNKSKRGESLLEIHQKKKKKEKKNKKSEKPERKAFDREEIAVRHFTEKQVNSVIDKAKYLNSRFAPGKSQQYL